MISKLIPLSLKLGPISLKARPTLHALLKYFDIDFYKHHVHVNGKQDFCRFKIYETFLLEGTQLSKAFKKESRGVRRVKNSYI